MNSLVKHWYWNTIFVLKRIFRGNDIAQVLTSQLFIKQPLVLLIFGMCSVCMIIQICSGHGRVGKTEIEKYVNIIIFSCRKLKKMQTCLFLNNFDMVLYQKY